MQPTICPDVSTLETFLLGRTPDDVAEQLEEHIAACPRCAARLAAVRAEDDLVAALRGAPGRNAEEGEVVRAVAPLLKQMYGHKDATASLAPAQGLDSTGTISLAATPFSGEKGRFSLDFLAPADEPGELGRLGPYRVLEVLGAGGMGVVLRAEDPRLRRVVAIKVIKAGLAAGAEAHRRFQQEAQAAAAVEHDNIVTIFEVNEDRGMPYLVMPLLRGQSLAERLQHAGGPLPIAELLHIGRQVADGLAAAHARGLVHRDIKPANIFLESGGRVSATRVVYRASGVPGVSASAVPGTPDTPDTRHTRVAGTPDARHSRIRILDFGLVQALDSDPSHSHAGIIVGTPAYMAPEQARREAVDGRADLFSLGCMLYQMATGKQPFAGPDVMSTLVRIAVDSPAPLRELNPALPPELGNLIVRLLAKDPRDRPTDAATVAQALRTLEEKQAQRARPRWPVWALAAVLVLAVGLVVAQALHRSADAPPQVPGTITFTTDEPELRFTLQPAEGDLQEIAVKQHATHQLAPGTYTLKAPAGKRKLWPGQLIVKAGEERKVALTLVGEVRAYQGHTGGVTGIAMPAKAGLLVLSAGGTDRSIAMWDAGKGEIVHSLEGHQTAVLSVAVSADGTRAVSGSGGKNQPPDLSVRVWDLTTGKEIARNTEHEHWVTAVAMSPDGKRVVSADAGGTVLLWDAVGDKKPLPLTAHEGRVNAVAFSSDGKYVVTAGDDGRARLSETNMGGLVDTAGIEEKLAVTGVAFGPVATTWLALSCSDGTLRIWDWKASKFRVCKPHAVAATCVAVSSDGKRLLSGGADGAVSLWNAADLKEIWTFTGHTKAVRGVAFAADNRYAASGGADMSVRLWKLPN